MSWSVQATGKAPAVAAEIERQFKAMESYPCAEPEESAKQLVRQTIATLCAGQTHPDAMAVKVAASGSQSWTAGDQHKPENVSNTLSLTFETLYGFIE